MGPGRPLERRGCPTASLPLPKSRGHPVGWVVGSDLRGSSSEAGGSDAGEKEGPYLAKPWIDCQGRWAVGP